MFNPSLETLTTVSTTYDGVVRNSDREISVRSTGRVLLYHPFTNS